MCDFSTQHAKSRKAEEGDKLTTHDFGHITRGFKDTNDIAVGSAATAVCLLPGTEIAFVHPVQIAQDFRRQADVDGTKRMLGGSPPADARVATFIQVDKDKPKVHHDALEFPDGTTVLLTALEAGQDASIVSLPAAPRTVHEQEYQRRAEFV